MDANEFHGMLAALADPTEAKKLLKEMSGKAKELSDATEKHLAAANKASNERNKNQELAEANTKEKTELEGLRKELQNRESEVLKQERTLHDKTLTTQKALDEREQALAKAEATITQRLVSAEQHVKQAERLRALWEKKNALLEQAAALS